jgi:MoxR-like ATPase
LPIEQEKSVDQDIATWSTWLESIPPDQRAALGLALEMKDGLMAKEAMASAFRVMPDPVGHSHVKVTRTPTQDLYITEPLRYIDSLQLHEIYKRIAYNSHLILKGPKGDGKTLSVLTFAAQTQTPIVIQECSEDTKAYHLMGSQTLLGDETVYVLGALPTAIDVANEVGKCILLFEEINALPPGVQKQLNAITDFRQMVSMPHIGRTYKTKPGCKLWVVGTMNPSVYGGTYDLNEDLKSRFEEIEVSYHSMKQEKEILRAVCGNLVDDKMLDLLIRFAKDTRQKTTAYSISTRDLVRLVQTVSVVGLDVALQMVVCKFEGEDRDVVLKRMASVFGNKNVKRFWGSDE